MNICRSKPNHFVPLRKPAALGLCLSLLLGSALTAQAQTLPEMLEAVRTTHPAIKAARQSIEAADKGVDAARGRYWPTLSTILETGSQNASSEPSKFLRLEQNLWDGGATNASVDTALSAVDVSRMQLARQEQQLQLQVVEAWQAAHTAQGRIAVAESVARRLQEHEAMMARRVQAEASTTVELQLIKSQVLQALIERRKAQANYAVAARRLEQLTGMAGLAEGLKQQPAPPEPQDAVERMSALLNKSWLQDVRQQPAVLLADAELEQGRRQVEAKRAEMKPQLYARVDRGLGKGGETSGFLGLRHSFNAGFSLSSELAALEAQVGALQASRDATVLQVEEQIQRNLSELEENAQRYQSLKLAVASSQTIHESYVRQFVAGRKSWLDVMSAIRDVAQNEYALNEVLHGFAGQLATLTLYEASLARTTP